MDRNDLIKRIMKRLLMLIVLIIIAGAFGLFFAFGGNNPLLIHVAHGIDMMLVTITVLIVFGLIYWVYTMLTGSGRAKTAKRSPANTGDIPELNDLIDSLDSSNT